jgi:sirohydrochlorin cobaltochelatase
LNSAYLLLSHGSRDPRPQIAVSQLAQQLSLYLPQNSSVNPPILVGTAQLELADRPLHLQIRDFALTWIEQEIDRIIILPLFLLPGVHVLEDIPAEIAMLDRVITDRVKLILTPFLGANPDLFDLVATNRIQLPNLTIILSHGSRKSGGNATVEQLATNLNLDIAYWSIAPSLTEQVTKLVATGATEIGILPYFLFGGGITDAIAELVSQLNKQFPQVKLILDEPIGNNPKLLPLLVKIFTSID